MIISVSENPFPSQGTSNLPGDPQTIVELETLASVTLPRPQLDRAFGFVRDYIQGHNSTQKGQFVALLGEHGSGKTHTINYLIGQSKTLQSTDTPRQNPFHFSIKLETADIGTFYRAVWAQIDEQPLRELLAVARDHAAIDQLKKLPEVNDDKAERLRGSREAAEKLYSGYLVDRGAVERLQIEEVSRLPRGREQFQRALPFLFGSDPELATHTYRWLSGLPVTESGLRAIGVDAPIDSTEMFKSGLQLLAALFRVARRPLLLYLDQFEKLVNVAVDTDTPDPESVGVLRRLVDEVPNRGGLVLIAGTPLAWDKMPGDLRERFGQHVVELQTLTDEEATKLVLLFLPSGLSPFQEGGIDALLKFSRGNIRRFLQNCSTMYALAEPSKVIDGSLVDEAIRSGSLKPPEEERAVLAAIEHQLTANGLRFVRNLHLYKQTVDYAIEAERDRPGIVIETTRAVYKDDETRLARKLVDLAEDVRSILGANSIVISVVLGYSTREVSDAIAGTVRQVFYDPRTFAEDFRAALKPPAPPPEAVPAGAPPGHPLRNELDVLRAELVRMQSQRDSEVDVLQQQIRDLLERSAPERAAPPGDLADRWHEERLRLESAIRNAREEHRNAEFQKLRHAGLAMEREWRNLHLRIGAIMAILFAGLLVVRFFVPGFLRLSDTSWKFLSMSLIALIPAALLLALSYFRFLQPAYVRRLSDPVDTLDQLEQLRVESPRAAARLLFHPRPEIRYVAARSVQLGDVPVRQLADWLSQERLPLVREAQALLLAETRTPLITQDLDSGRIPEAIYLAERLADEPRLSDSRLRITYQLANQGIDDYFARYGRSPQLRKAFDTGDVSVQIASFTNRQSAKNALRDLSPFDGGIGAFPALRILPLVDQLYFFWAEVSFVLDRVRPPAPPPNPAA